MQFACAACVFPCSESFSLISLGLILILAFGLASLLKAQIEQRALRNAEALAQAVGK